MQLTPDMILPTVALLGYGSLAAFILIRRGIKNRAMWLLAGYFAVSVIWTLGVLLSFAQSPASLRWNRVTVYAGPGIPIVLLWLVLAFFRRWRSALGWLLFGGLGLGATFFLDPDVLAVIRIGPWQVGGWRIGQADLINVTVFLIWGIFVLALLVLLWREYQRPHGPLHRNRIRYLSLAVVLAVVGDGLYALDTFLGAQIAPLIKLGGATAIAYAILNHHLPDIRQVYRKSISYTLITLMTIGVFFLGILLFRTVSGFGATLGAVVVAMILTLGYLPLRRATRRLIDQFLFGKSYEHDRMLRNYEQRIADILNLERLATVVIGVIHEGLGIERGALLVTEGGDDGISIVRLKPYAGLGTVPGGIIEFRGSSPLLIHLRLKGLPVVMYDLDFQLGFEEAHQKERDGLQAMKMDVFVPIRAKERLVGVLAVGAKLSGEPYSSADLDLLSTLADQTAMALENARFFEDLMMLNDTLSRAYTAREKANRQLQEMDKLKSAFIGVVTHELRTPFANIGFSLQLLERYAHANLPPEQREQLDELAAGIQSAGTMVDNLVTFASYLSKQGELRLAWMNFDEVIRDTLLPLKTMAEAKGVALHIDMSENMPSLQGDPERLSEAVHHLAQNAIKFTGADGDVWVRCWATSDAAHFEVKDTGVGVPADKLPTLWEGFSQMADPLRRGVEGMGLGLALVKYIVNAHGGQVWVHSEEGVGSTFGFQVPLGGPEDQTAPEPIHVARLKR